MSVALSDAATAWLVDGEHGMSSMAMFHRIVLGRPVDPRNRPYDVDDFRRCEMLRRAVPEVADGLGLMASVSPLWSRLVARWGEVADRAESELPDVFSGRGYGRCPAAYALLEEIEKEPLP